MTPHLNTPQPPPPHHHDGFLGFLVKAIVIAVVCVAVPELAPGLIPVIAGALGVSEAIVTAVGVGLVDAAAQGLCIGLGVQDHFSLAELATTIITAGLGSQLGPLSAEFTSAELMEYIVQAGLVNVEEQLAEMALGIRHQFDLAGVALAMGSAGLSSEIKIANPLERSIVADLSVAAMGGVVRGRIDVENLAIQLISDSARYAVQQSYANSSSDEYHQSQKASRGEGHITQTTVDQQWESHLINDAEFTANTPLPSVTLDSNNAQLGQRVGEEVSHFYHPTPPPARNPSGFWRGVDNVLKMRQGTINAVSSRFTGNYETPQDPWEKAGYVLGEAIENRFTGGRVIGNVQKLERFGFFGHNGAEEPLSLLGNEASNHINALRLQRSFTIEQAKSIFDDAGGLLPEVIQKSIRLDIEFKNTELKEMLSTQAGNLSDWRKYITESVPSPSGNFRMHFYHNPVTGDVYYGMDYKAVFNHDGSWKLPLLPNFEYKPPHFTL